MREFLNQEPVISSDTYLGARMNQKALTFHTQLHDWSEAQNLSALANKHSNILSSAKDGEGYLPVKKIAHIEYWTRQVNRYYRPHRNNRPKSGSFMKIDVTKYNMKVDKNEPSRSKSAIYPNRQQPVSAVTRLPSAPRRRFFGTDVHTVNNNLIDSQMHYSAQRRNLYSATTKKSIKSTKADNFKHEPLENGESEMNGSLKVETESETTTLIENTNSSKVSDLDSQGYSHIDTEVMQPHIVSRSYSNRMLNVISIDDCKLTCRYRPQIIKENHLIPDDLEDMQKARANKLRYDDQKLRENKEKAATKMKTEEVTGNEADDEADNSEETVDIVENIETLRIDVIPEDTNNNDTANTCHIENDENADEVFEINDLDNIDSNKVHLGNKITDKSTSSESTESSDRSRCRQQHNKTNENGPVHDKINTSSQVPSKTSYGRITSLYTSSESIKPQATDRKRKNKRSRASRINYAINDMVQERKVMNSLERDFDTRTQEFGRTIVEKTEGSETFKKIHAKLRKKIDAFVDTHSAVKTKEFYERSRSSSATNSVTNQ